VRCAAFEASTSKPCAAETHRHGENLTSTGKQKDLQKTNYAEALFALSKDGAFCFFLETEKSKLGKYVNGKPQIIRKLARYYDYYNSADCEQEWDFKKFRVVVIVQTEERRKNLLRHLFSGNLNHRMFCIATEAEPFHCLTPKDYEERSYSFLNFLRCRLN
jgi:hypothetical protein